MPIYIAVPLSPSPKPVDDVVVDRIPAVDRYALQNNRGWLIRFEGTTVELSTLLGLSKADKGAPPTIGSAIIVPVTGYYGRGPTDMWEWLKTRLEQ